MKNIAIILALAATLLGATATNAQGLKGIQQKIDAATGQAFGQNSLDGLNEVEAHLNTLENKGGQHWVDYWKAYLEFQKASYYANSQNADEEAALAGIKKTLEILQNIENKNSEDYALMAITQSSKLRYVKGMKIMGEAQKAEMWAEIAMEKDANNPRAYYVAGLYDYYKPAMYGGGKKSKTYLSKALELYADAIPNPITPSWGHDDSYAKLARTYLKKKHKDVEKANSLAAEGLEKFPYHYDLKALTAELNAE